MFRRFLIVASVLTFSFGILFTSVLRTAAVKYAFSGKNGQQVLGEKTSIQIDYYLPYEGKVLPDHFLWPLKSLRDKIWLFLTTNQGKRAELKLLFADKRLASSKVLFERNKGSIAFSTLTKAEKYLEEASLQEEKNRARGDETSDFLLVLAKAALKHRQVINEILLIAPDDAKPEVIKIEDYPKKVFEKAMHALNEKGLKAPQNPFDGD